MNYEVSRELLRKMKMLDCDIFFLKTVNYIFLTSTVFFGGGGAYPENMMLLIVYQHRVMREPKKKLNKF
jgi:hypothetical protein